MSAVIRFFAALIIFSFSCSSAFAANRYDPRLHFRTITTSHFAVHFHQCEETMARRLATLAEDVFTRVSKQIGTPSGRVHGLGVALASLGQICVRVGNLKRAEDALNRALDVRSPLHFMTPGARGPLPGRLETVDDPVVNVLALSTLLKNVRLDVGRDYVTWGQSANGGLAAS